jgi:hypothetical protein
MVQRVQPPLPQLRLFFIVFLILAPSFAKRISPVPITRAAIGGSTIAARAYFFFKSFTTSYPSRHVVTIDGEKSPARQRCGYCAGTLYEFPETIPPLVGLVEGWASHALTVMPH